MVVLVPGLRTGGTARTGARRSWVQPVMAAAVHAGMLAAMVPLILAASPLVHVAVCTALVGGSAALARAARTERPARGLIVDLWAMAALVLLMVPGGTTTVPLGHHHGTVLGGPVGEAVVVLLWLVARLLLPSLRPPREARWHVIPAGMQLAAMLAMPLVLR